MNRRPRWRERVVRGLWSLLALAVVGTVGFTTCAQIRANQQPREPLPDEALPVSTVLPPRDAGVDAPVAPELTAKLGMVACGDRYCKGGKELCCLTRPVGSTTGTPRVGRCVPAQPKNEAEKKLPDAICARVIGEGPEFEGVECDDSTTCGPGRACCATFRAGHGAPQTVKCVSTIAKGRFPCDFEEYCGAGGACLTQGATCKEGTCEVPHPTTPVSCGGATCSAEKPACCLTKADAWTCSTHEECGEGKVFECTSAKDCPRGEFCALTLSRATCMHYHQETNVPVLCEKPEDCALEMRRDCVFKGKLVTCRATKGAPHGTKLCGCEAG